MLSTASNAAFGGKPPLGPGDALRRELQPYDLAQLNYLGMNYCENLLDLRLNITGYSHLNSNSPTGDAWNLQFPDDAARLVEGVAWEADFSPVARVEFARRLVKGLMSSYVPGAKAYHAFRHRSGGKTFLILGGDENAKEGRVTMSNWGDSLEGALKIGFRAEKHGKWAEMDGFTYSDDPHGIGGSGMARSGYYWNLSPVIFNRHFAGDAGKVDFTGRYWMSDENMPLEYSFRSADADRLQIVVGEPGKPMAMMPANTPGIIHMPDRLTTFASDKAGNKSFDHPAFNHIILRKPASWGSWCYSTALLIMWDGRPERVDALAENGYGEIRISYPKTKSEVAGRVWVVPYPIVNTMDMEYIYRNAESFLRGGKLLQNGFPPQQMLNAIPAGLAAGAYMLTKYNDPMAPTARINAQNAVDEVFEGERHGMKLMRTFFPVRAAAWMIKTGKLLGDEKMVAKYTEDLGIVMKRLLSSDLGYDGKGWPGGWDHFNSTKAAWLAYDATGNPEYKAAWERALTVYTIDENGMYRYGKKMDAPGGFDTYFGSMPLGVWGNAGMLDSVDRLINLDVPTEPNSKITLKNMWNDSGAGPWAQDDANPEYVGLSLKGLGISQDRKLIIPVGAFPRYDAAGNVDITRQPILDNPFFLNGRDKLRVASGTEAHPAQDVKRLSIKPGSDAERMHAVHAAGKIVEGSRRVVTGADGSLVYRFDTKGASGVGLDLRIQGGGFQIDASPDGRRWYKRLDTWSDTMGDQSLDLSFLTGSRDELVNIVAFDPSTDSRYLSDAGKSYLERKNCRYVPRDGALTYRLDLPDVVESHLELMLGNGYRIECSNDGRTWHEELTAEQPKGVDPKSLADAAWIRMVDVTKYLKTGHTVYLRLSDQGDAGAYGGHTAFIRRLSAYSALDSGKVFVRISNVSSSSGQSFTIENLTLRTWKSE